MVDESAKMVHLPLSFGGNRSFAQPHAQVRIARGFAKATSATCLLT